MLKQTNYEFKKMLKDRFVFCYSCPMMNYLRHHETRYLCKGVHEVTGNPFWLFDRTEEIENLIKAYIKERNNKDEEANDDWIKEI